jgi:hypothetical protein
MIVAWTGHRPDLFRDPAVAWAEVDSAARALVNHEAVTQFLVGGQRGVDTWAALSAIALGVPFSLILPLPLPTFTLDWSDTNDRKALDRIASRAIEVRVASGDPDQAFTERNRLLATSADLLVAVWTGIEGGGTAETIAFARRANTPVREVVLEPSPTALSARGRGI